MINSTVIQMKKTIAKLLARLLAIICGYSLWYLFSQSALIEKTLQVPITWYDIPEQKEIISQDTIDVRISTTRKNLKYLDSLLSRVYINGNQLRDGIQEIALTKKNFFVPHDLKLVHCYPSFLVVTVQDKKI